MCTSKMIIKVCSYGTLSSGELISANVVRFCVGCDLIIAQRLKRIKTARTTTCRRVTINYKFADKFTTVMKSHFRRSEKRTISKLYSDKPKSMDSNADL